MTRQPAKLRNLALVAAGMSALALASITAFSKAGGYPPLPKSALFQAVTPRNIDQVRNRINGSTGDRNQIPFGTVLVYKTSAGNLGKMQIHLDFENGASFTIVS